MARFDDQNRALPPAAARLATVTLGQRPEHLRLAPGVGRSGIVEHVENLRREMILTPATGEGPFILRDARPEKLPAVGQPVHLTPEPDHRGLFDPASGPRIE